MWRKSKSVDLSHWLTLFKSSRDMFYSRGFVKRESVKKPQTHQSHLVTTTKIL